MNLSASSTLAGPLGGTLDPVDADPVPAARRKRRDALLLRYLNPAPQFELVTAGHPARHEAEAFVAARYRQAYQAELSHFMPWLLTMRCLGGVSAVAGLRPAAEGPLYLERYLDAPLESLLAEHAGTPVARETVAEIGNLVAAERGASHLLFLLFTCMLERAGHEWIAFTATRALRNNLAKLGFPLITLQEADASRLPPDERAGWGSYYATEPLVVAGRLGSALDIVRSRPLLRRVLRLYRYRINYLAEELGGC